jgi:hypothetical protein
LLGLDYEAIRAKLDAASWSRITKPQLQVQLLLGMIAANQTSNLMTNDGYEITLEDLRKLVIRSIVVTESPSIKTAAPSEAGEKAKKLAA